MSTHLCITVRWIGDQFHGFIDGTETLEWPPAPFRLFQALVAGAYRYGLDTAKHDALAWIERQRTPPDVLAPVQPLIGNIFDHWVPDNDNLVEHRRGSIRKFCPMFLQESPAVHYVWPIDSSDQPPLAALDEITSTLSSLGWATDQAYAVVMLVSVEEIDATILKPSALHRFLPAGKTISTYGSLRVPKQGSICDLEQVHFANRRASQNQAERRRKKWPKIFDRILYTSIERPIGRPYRAFRLVDENGDPYRYPHAKFIHIAGMVRHAAIELMKKDPPPGREREKDPTWLETFVCGHRSNGELRHEQLSYVPLPSIGHEHADAMIRNIMVIAPFGRDGELEHLAKRLDGAELSPQSSAEFCAQQSAFPPSSRIFLELFNPPPGKFIAKCYIEQSHNWQSVTPVILDGYNRKSKTEKPEVVAARTKYLIQRSLARAGVEAPCEYEWQAVPLFKNTLSAHKYDRNGHHTGYHRPAHLRTQTAVHVRIRFGRREIPDNMDSRWIRLESPFPGPLTLGAGRHCGFGLMAAAP
jgi:CRISPR-associated protein Csb2